MVNVINYVNIEVMQECKFNLLNFENDPLLLLDLCPQVGQVGGQLMDPVIEPLHPPLTLNLLLLCLLGKNRSTRNKSYSLFMKGKRVE